LSSKLVPEEEKFLNALAEAYRLQESIIGATELAIISTNTDGIITSFNRAAEHMLGYSADEVIGKLTPLIFHEPDEIVKRALALSAELHMEVLPDFDAFVAKARILHVADRQEWMYIRKDQSRVPVVLSLTALRNDDKALIGYASIATDITEQKKAQEELMRSKNNLEIAARELQEQNRQLDEFAHIISHNLRSPVSNIKALIGLLNDQSSVQEYRTIFEKLKNVSSNLGETMNELMETLRAKKNTNVEVSEIRFKELLDKIVQSLEGDLIHSEATISFDFDKAPAIQYSKSYLESILQNLLSNAIKYRSPNRRPEIHFSSSVVKEKVVLRVADNGLGIDLEKFGDKLFGLHKTFHDNKEARGVGLFLTKTQIEAMGGTISVESEVDRGATFIIQF
jgi:signal transduction histidine kinase